jgi:4-hydroxy-3-polyprenylbenzoate decarboxylase
MIMSDPTAISDLRQFLALLEQRRELHRIAVEVDPALELAAITDRVCKGAGGRRALLFQRVLGHRTPVATNLFGSSRRAAWALGVERLETAVQRLEKGLEYVPGEDADTRLQHLLQKPRFVPRLKVGRPCHEITMPCPDLSLLPALRSWPGDGGRYLNLPQVFTRHPEGGSANCGMYRLQILGPQRAAVHWREASDAAHHCRAWHARGLPMPVSIALGGHPTLLFAATFPLPPGCDEAAFAALLHGRPMAMTSSLTSDLQVPQGAEFVIEGLVYPGERVEEGPFGNHTGFYQPSVRVPLLRVSSISHRADPILATTVVGPPPMENCYLGKVAERLLLCLLRIDHPEILDINMPVEGIFHGVTLISVKANTCGKTLLHGLWEKGPLQLARLLVITTDGDTRDPATFFWRTLNRCDPRHDLLMRNGRVGIDATAAPQGLQVLQPDEHISEVLRQRWSEYGFD